MSVKIIGEKYKPRLKYSDQAATMLRNLPDLDLKDFEKWVEDNVFIVGDKYFNAYLLTKDNGNNK